MADALETKPEETGSGGSPAPRRGGWLWKLGLGIAAAAVCLAAGLWAFSAKGADGGAASSAGNQSDEAVLDEAPPQLLGVQDMTVALGGTVSYRDGVTAVDDTDGPLSFQVDASAVDLSAAGEYPVTYSARDAAGNETQITITVTVIETLTVDQDMEEPDEEEPASSGSSGGGAVSLSQITREDVDQLSDQILAKITTSGMSQREKAQAIYNYVSQHVRYVGTSDKSSWIVGAYVGFTRGRGDCYNYYACSKALLTRAGISNVDLYRVGGTSSHYWQLVNTGDGWYHFDACPHPNGYPLYSFMITETQVRAYTELASPVRQNYYVYDYASCPVRAVGMPEEEIPTPPAEEDPAGEELDPGAETPDGSQLPENPDSSEFPDGEFPDSSQPAEGENPDGSQPPEEVSPDGSQPPEEVSPDGSQPPEEDGSDAFQRPEEGGAQESGGEAAGGEPQMPDSSAQTNQEAPPETGGPVADGEETPSAL